MGEAQDVQDAKAYLEKHGICELLESLLQHLTEKRPNDVFVGIADWANRQSASRKMDLAVRRGTQLQHNTGLSIYTDSTHVKKAIGLICTIGPVSQPVAELETLLDAGMTIVRMNCSHGDHAFHGKTIDNAREAAKNKKLTVAIALDTKGPEIRTGNIKDNKELVLPKGHEITLTTDPAFKDEGCMEKLYVDYPNITKVMEIGQEVFIDDGLLALRIEAISGGDLKTVVVNPSTISSRRGVNLPHVEVDLPAVSEKDKEDLKFAVEKGVDMIFASFIRKASQVKEVRTFLSEAGPEGKRVKVISKIENHEGIQNFDSILEASDGIMVARGDLGTEIPIEKVFVAQKMMVSKCNVVGKPCIVATQMLESMISNPRPTRAEASDVANAVLDGADVVMLSGETAKGAFRRECVEMMKKITMEAQLANRESNLFDSIKAMRSLPVLTPESIACAAVNSAYELDAKAIIALTNTGDTARRVAKFRPPCPIIAVTNDETTARQVLLHRFIKPLMTDLVDRDERVAYALEHLVAIGAAAAGDRVVMVHAGPNVKHGKGFANQTRVVVVK